VIKINLISFLLCLFTLVKGDSFVQEFSSGNSSFCILYQPYINDTMISVVNEVENNSGDIVINKHYNNKIVWSQRIDLNNNSYDRAYVARLEINENAIVIYGNIRPTHNFIFKIDLNNNKFIFKKMIRNLQNSASCLMYKLIKLRQSGDYVALGIIDYSNTTYLLRLKSNDGSVVWSKEKDFNGKNELIYSICEDGDNNIVLGGGVLSGSYEATFIKINPSDANTISVKKYSTGTLDDCIYIPNTDYIAYISTNSNSSGIVLFNFKNETIQEYAYFSHLDKSRTINIRYNEKLKIIVVGGHLINSKNDNNMFFQVFNIDNIQECDYYTLKNINYATNFTDRVFLHLNDDRIYISGLFANDNQSKQSFIVGEMSYSNDTMCYRKHKAIKSNISLIASSRVSFVNKLNINVLELNPSIKNISYTSEIKCRGGCLPTKKEAKISIMKNIDSLCLNQKYITQIKIIQNLLNEDVKLTIYQNNEASLIKLYDVTGNADFTIELPFLPSENKYVFISQSNCSFNDTVFLTLIPKTLEVVKKEHDSLFCVNENINLEGLVLRRNSSPLKFEWTNLGETNILDTFRIYEEISSNSKKIQLKVYDYCVETPVYLYFSIWEAPKLKDRFICNDTIGCKVFNIELRHPKTIGNSNMKTPFTWNWYLDNKLIESKSSMAFDIINNVFYSLPYSGKHSLKLEMKLSNKKVCEEITQNIMVLKRAKASFDFSLNGLEISDTVVQFINKSAFADSYLWNTSDGFAYKTVSPFHQFKNVGKYSVQLIAMNSNNCNDTVIKEIEVFENFKIFFPNAFSPNIDNINNFWKPSYESVKEIDVMIFNRWGELILKSNSVDFS